MSPGFDAHENVPVVTVAMSAFNAAATIQCAVRSIVAQTFAGWELVVVDDGSSDATAELAAAIRDPRISVLRDGSRRGLAARMNQIVARARGKYIARMDADDVAYPERLERQVAHLEHHPEIDLVGSSAMAFAGDGEPIGAFVVQSAHEAICAHPAAGFVLPHPTWLARREWLHRHGYRETARRAQDQDLLLRAHPSSRYANVPEILLGYRQAPLKAMDIFRARWHYGRALWRFGFEHGAYGLALRGSVAQVVRALVAANLVSLGLGKSVARRRYREAQARELAQWRTVWSALCARSPTS